MGLPEILFLDSVSKQFVILDAKFPGIRVRPTGLSQRAEIDLSRASLTSVPEADHYTTAIYRGYGSHSCPSVLFTRQVTGPSVGLRSRRGYAPGQGPGFATSPVPSKPGPEAAGRTARLGACASACEVDGGASRTPPQDRHLCQAVQYSL
jgi:hypothetical protein